MMTSTELAPIGMKAVLKARSGNASDSSSTRTITSSSVTVGPVRDTVAEGGDVLFVGTKKQAQEPIKTQAERCGMYYINNRWLGGTLTNWQTIQNSIATLSRLQDLEESGKIEAYSKKEGVVMRKRRFSNPGPRTDILLMNRNGQLVNETASPAVAPKEF